MMNQNTPSMGSVRLSWKEGFLIMAEQREEVEQDLPAIRLAGWPRAGQRNPANGMATSSPAGIKQKVGGDDQVTALRTVERAIVVCCGTATSRPATPASPKFCDDLHGIH